LMAIAYLSTSRQTYPEGFFSFSVDIQLKEKKRNIWRYHALDSRAAFRVPGCRNADRFLILFVFFRTIRRSLPHTHTHTHTHQFIDPFFPFILHSHRHHSLCK
jgi:hypothetical protein